MHESKFCGIHLQPQMLMAKHINDYFLCVPTSTGDNFVRCKQTNKTMTVKVHQLSLPEGCDITEKHLAPESQVLLEEDGQDFPVTVMSCLKKPTKRVQQPLSESSEEK